MELENVKDYQEYDNTIIITMEYLGKCLSVNHYKYKGRYTDRRTKRWQDDLTFIIGATVGDRKFTPPVSVRVDGVFKDKRSTPDMDNLLKVINDAVKRGIGIDDKYFTNETGEPFIGGEPELTITISGKNEKNTA